MKVTPRFVRGDLDCAGIITGQAGIVLSNGGLSHPPLDMHPGQAHVNTCKGALFRGKPSETSLAGVG